MASSQVSDQPVAFRYEPLVQDKSIRLLNYLVSPEGLIVGSLRCVELCEDLTYSALSYTWEYAYPSGRLPNGAFDIERDNDDGPQHELSIILNDQSLAIKPNLYDALLQLHASGLNYRLWVDAICINQQDLPERNAQVNMMGDIYSQASSVVVWLGKEDGETPICTFLISMFADISKRILSIPQTNWDYFEYKNQGLLFSAGMPLPVDPEWWRMLARFLQRTWFGRLWTLQEIALRTSDTVEVLCGEQKISWSDLMAFSEVLAYTGIGSGLVELMPGQLARGEGAVGRIAGAYGDLQNMCRGKKLFELQHEQMWGLTPHVRATGYFKIPLTDELLAKPPPTQNRGAVLMFLISQTALFHVSDPRDKIFALLGLVRKISFSSEDTSMDVPDADYSKTLEDVYYEAFRYIVEATQRPYSLALAGDVGTKTLTALPSWVSRYWSAQVVPISFCSRS